MDSKEKTLKRLVDHQIELIAVFEKDDNEHLRHGYLRHQCGCSACKNWGKPYVFDASLSIVVPFVRHIGPDDVSKITKIDGVHHLHIRQEHANETF